MVERIFPQNFVKQDYLDDEGDEVGPDLKEHLVVDRNICQLRARRSQDIVPLHPELFENAEGQKICVHLGTEQPKLLRSEINPRDLLIKKMNPLLVFDDLFFLGGSF